MNEKFSRASDGAGKRSNEDIYALLYQIDRRLDELNAAVRQLKLKSEESENQ